MKLKVIGVIGLPASGKGVFSRLARGAGIPVVVMGDVIRKEGERLGIPLTDNNLGSIAKRFREEQGMDAIAKLTLPVIDSFGSGIVLVDGIRGVNEINLYRSKFPDFLLVAITALFHERLNRLKSRGRADDSLSERELEARENRESGFGLIEALETADIVIENSGSINEFEEKVRDFLSKNGVIL